MTSEFELIDRYFKRTPRTALLGVGDDCALVKQPDGLALAVTTDMLVEGVHFFPDADPRSLGHKALAVNLSDLAAMGAEPRWATLSIALPRVEERWLAEFSAGFFALADRFLVDLIGGDTTRGPLTLSLTLLGISPPGLALRRDGAQAGDDIWLSGRTGEAALAVLARRERVRLSEAELAACRDRLDRPEPRVALGLALRRLASAAIDVSDGLAQDLGHVCRRSGVAAEVDLTRLPRAPAVIAAGEAGLEAMLAGGDDYELCFTAPPGVRVAIEAAGERLGVALSRIGEIRSGPPAVTLLDAERRPFALARGGFDHFG